MDPFQFNFVNDDATRYKDLNQLDISPIMATLPKNTPRQKSLVFNKGELAAMYHSGSDGRHEPSYSIGKKPETAVHGKRRRNQFREISTMGPSLSSKQTNAIDSLEPKVQSNNAFHTTDTQGSTEMKSAKRYSQIHPRPPNFKTGSVINWNKSSHGWTHTPRNEFAPTTKSNDRTGFTTAKSFGNFQFSQNQNKNFLVTPKLESYKYGSDTQVDIADVVQIQHSQSIKEGEIKLKNVQSQNDYDEQLDRNHIVTPGVMTSHITSHYSAKSQQVANNPIRNTDRLTGSKFNFNDTQSLNQPIYTTNSHMNSAIPTYRSQYGSQLHRRTSTCMPTNLQKQIHLNQPIKQMEMRKLSHRIHNLRKNVTRYKLDQVNKKMVHSRSNVQRTALPDPETAIQKLPGFHVTSNVVKRHYTKGINIKSPKDNQYRLSLDSNNQQLTKRIAGNYRVRNLKSSTQFYEVVMPQRFYENQIKDKMKSDIKSKMKHATDFHQAIKQANLIAQAERNKGSYEDQMLRPKLQFVGTEAETEYLARQALQQHIYQNITQPQKPVKSVEAPPDTDATIMRRIFDKEKKFNKKEHKESMELSKKYNFPTYGLWDQEIPLDRSSIIESIEKMIASMAPNSIHARNYIDQIQYEISRMNIHDLTKTVHHLRLIKKYDKVNTDKAGVKIEAFHQISVIKKLGDQDKLEKEKEAFRQYAHYFKHHRNLHTCEVPILGKVERMILDIVYTACMFELKRLINCCFDPMHDPKRMEDSSKYWTLGQALSHLEHQMSYGPYTNTELIDLAAKSYINAEELIDMMIPRNLDYYPMIVDALSQINRRSAMLRGASDINILGIERLMPLLRSNGVLHLSNITIDHDFTKQILVFFSQLKIHPIIQKPTIHRVIIDNIKINQNDLLELLKCFVIVKTYAKYDSESNFSNFDSHQHLHEPVKNIEPNTAATNITGLTLSNIELKSEVIQFISINLLPQLYNLEMTNITYVNTGKRKCFVDDLIVGLDDLPEDVSLVLLRLKISNIDLSKQFVYLKQLIDKSQRSLIDIDLSWCNLNFSNFKDLFKSLIQIGQNDAKQYKDNKVRGVLRNLNLSYNPAHFIGEIKKQKAKKKKKSKLFEDISSSSESDNGDMAVDQIDELGDLFIYMIKGFYFKKLVHIDLSGINNMFQKEIIKIIEQIGDVNFCPNLCSIHLSELNINFSEEIQDAVTENFDTVWGKEVEQDHLGGLYIALMAYLENWRGQDYRFKQADKFKYTDVIQKTINDNPLARRQHNLLNCIHMDLIQKQKQGIASGSFSECHGIGRIMHKGHCHDHFIIHKGINLPELVFNQDPRQDQNVRKRYFEVDHFGKWTVSDNQNKKNSCFICQKQMYVIIFYERTEGANKNLLEIQDKEFIKKCRAEYKLKHSLEKKNLKKIKTPLICGTVVTDRDESIKVARSSTNPITNMTFDRKLRMIRADIFALLSLTTHGGIFKTQDHQTLMKKHIITFLASEFNYRAEKMYLFNRLIGWNKLLHMKCFKNQIHQVYPINLPDCVSNVKAPLQKPTVDHYAFAAMLDPGYHQFMIYDPALNKAFCQEFVLEPSDQWIVFPELPQKIQQQKKSKPLPPVFNKWIKDTIQRFELAYDLDTSTYSEDGGKTFKDKFCPERFLKDPDEIKKCESIIRENFDCIQTMYIDILANSKKYPSIGLPSLQQGVLDITEQYSISTGDNFIIDPAQIEVAFISATRDDSPADRSLSRGEFLEMIIRIAYIKRNLAQEKLRKLQKKNALAALKDKFSNPIQVESAVGFGNSSKKQTVKTIEQSETSDIHTDSSYEDEIDESFDETSSKDKTDKMQTQLTEKMEFAIGDLHNQAAQHQEFHEYDDGGHRHHDDSDDSEESPYVKDRHKNMTTTQAQKDNVPYGSSIGSHLSDDMSQKPILKKAGDGSGQKHKSVVIQNPQMQHGHKYGKQSMSPEDPHEHHHHHRNINYDHFSWRHPDQWKQMKQRQNLNEQKEAMEKYSSMFKRQKLLKFETVEINQMQDVPSNLSAILKYGFWQYHESSLITTMRKQIQNDSKVVRELAKRLKELKKLFKKNCIKGKFTFDSALQLFEIDGTTFKESQVDKSQSIKESKASKQEQLAILNATRFWQPLTAFDIWPPFARSMMTILNEQNNLSKYNHLLLVEYYEYIGRIAFRYDDLVSEQQRLTDENFRPRRRQDNFKMVAEFLDKLLDRQIELGNLKKREREQEEQNNKNENEKN